MNVLLLSPYPRNKVIHQFLLEKKCNVLAWTDLITLDFLLENKIDYLVSNGYAPIIKEPIISHFKHKIINVHATYLPFGRGTYGNFWSFFEGTPKGVTLHFIDAGIDSGEIILRKEIPLSNQETLKTSWEILENSAVDLFCKNWEDIVNQRYQLISQDQLKETASYHNRKLSDRYLNILPKKWDTPLYVIEEMGKEFRLSEAEFWNKYETINRGK